MDRTDHRAAQSQPPTPPASVPDSCRCAIRHPMTDAETAQVVEALEAARGAGDADAIERRTEQLKFCPRPVRGGAR